jgi:hypothetical protein
MDFALGIVVGSVITIIVLGVIRARRRRSSFGAALADVLGGGGPGADER